MENKALISVLFIVLLLGPAYGATPASKHVLIYEVSPYSYSGAHMDYVCLLNPATYTINLTGMKLTDFEGYITLKGEIRPGQKIYIAENSTAFAKFMGFAPQYTYHTLPHTGKFALSNRGDEVAILDRNQPVDMLVYGKSGYTGPGWSGTPVSVHRGHVLRRLGPTDTNTARDWSNYHRIGQSDFKPYGTRAKTELFTLPDDRKEVLRFIDSAQTSIEIESYTLSDPKITELLLNKSKAGVTVKLLVEGEPVGGMHGSEKYALHTLESGGVQVRELVSNFGAHSRYSYMHSKFVIVDSTRSMILTENLDSKSLAPCGNRGFGAIIYDKSVAQYLHRIFYFDFKDVQDIRNYSNELYSQPEHEPIEVRAPEFSPINTTAQISIVVAPDFAGAAFNRFINSQKSIDVEAMYIHDSALARAYPHANRIMVWDPVPGYHMKKFDAAAMNLRMLHGKLMIGSNAVFFGSVNFGNHSLTQNREISIIVHSHVAVNYFEKVFNHDWTAKQKPTAIMKITRTGPNFKVNLSKSQGRITEYDVYVDGTRVYAGSSPVTVLHLAPGTHIITGEIKTARTSAKTYTTVHVPTSAPVLPDPRAILFGIILAVFLYKLRKTH